MFPNGATLELVGEMFGVTRERIRQIEAKALKKLKMACAHEGLSLADFLRLHGVSGHADDPDLGLGYSVSHAWD